VHKNGTNIIDVTFYGIDLKAGKAAALTPVHRHLGCGLMNSTISGGAHFVDLEWPQRCLYSNVVRSLIRDGSGTRLSSMKDSLFK
jgi:hypothetical protein